MTVNIRQFQDATPEIRQEMFREAAQAFQRDFARDIDTVCEGLVYVPQDCGVDNGPIQKTGGPFSCHMYGSPHTMTCQYSVVEGLEHLKKAVDPQNPLKLVHQYSYGMPGTNIKGLYHDGNSFIRWVTNFMPGIEKFAKRIANENLTSDVQTLSSGMREAVVAVVTLGEFLLPGWSLNNRLQNISTMLDDLGRGYKMAIPSPAEDVLVQLPHPAAARTLERWRGQIRTARYIPH